MSDIAAVNNSLCTGCGVCVSEDLNNSTYMVWNEDGFLVPNKTKRDFTIEMNRVCPFNPKPELNEDDLANEFLIDNRYTDSDIGKYTSLYAGYSKVFRETSSSGGIATFIFEKLLLSRTVDHLFIVKELDGKYAYQLFNDVNDIKKISKTRYYPVTLESLFTIINELDGKVAVSGVACFLKAIRLKQHYNPILKEKITFLVGIICGGLKSRHYTDFLAQSAGCNNDYHSAQYRVKNEQSFALDYKFSCVEDQSQKLHAVQMRALGDMWGTGLFKSKACDFCDDVTTELADISLGDAWIPPFNKEGLGNSILITRSAIADRLITDGLSNDELHLSEIDLGRIKKSQSGSFNHRHKGLLFRVNIEKKKKAVFPQKRTRFLKTQGLLSNIIQIQRMLTRSKSLSIWNKYRNINDFNKNMKPYLFMLRKTTGLSHKIIKLKSIIVKSNRNEK